MRAEIHEKRRLLKEAAATFEPNWANPRMRLAAEYGCLSSDAMGAVSWEIDSYDNEALWESLNKTAHNKAVKVFLDEGMSLEDLTGRVTHMRGWYSLTPGIAAGLKRPTLVLRALRRVIHTHSTGAKSERFTFTFGCLAELTDEEPETGWRAFARDYPYLGTHINFHSLTTPEALEQKLGEQWEWSNERWPSADPKDAYVRRYMADARFRGTVGYADVVQIGVQQGGSWVQRYAYVAPMSLNDEQAETYEALRESGLKPEEAELAALAV